ncbi:hypothetical protein AN958_10374 [Leucoagaricus sp. SymC.cos]|nr:hypothetical protein AN958_10374 [Leucoagaricus sp. SymC.cos]
MSAIEQPTTPRKRVPLSSILDPSNTQQGLPTPFTTPRRRKQPPQLPSIPPPEELWPRLGAKIPLETLKQLIVDGEIYSHLTLAIGVITFYSYEAKDSKMAS